jgi:hypothetical protein
MTGSQDNNELEKSATLESIRNSHISSTSSSYIELKMLLDERRWEDAQYETIKVMYEIVSQMYGHPLCQDGVALYPEDLEHFPCEDLLLIDQLWVEASEGYFGFSIQKKIWEEYGSPISHSYGQDFEEIAERYYRFLVAIGRGRWNENEFEDCVHPKFSLIHSPKGELPYVIGDGSTMGCGHFLGWEEVLVMQRINRCEGKTVNRPEYYNYWAINRTISQQRTGAKLFCD